MIDFYDYGHDPAGNRTSMTSAAGTESYTINLLNQLTGVSIRTERVRITRTG